MKNYNWLLMKDIMELTTKADHLINILNIVKYISSHPNFSYAYKEQNSDMICSQRQTVAVLCKLFKRTMVLYLESYVKYFKSQAQCDQEYKVIYDSTDEISELLLPIYNTDKCDLPIIAEIIGILMHIIVQIHRSGSKDDVDWDKIYCKDYFELCLSDIEKNIKYCVSESTETAEEELRLLIGIIFRMFLKHDWLKHHDDLSVQIRNLMQIYIESLSICTSEKYVSVILNYGLYPYLKLQSKVSIESIQFYFDKLWIIAKSIYNSTQGKQLRNRPVHDLSPVYCIICFLISLDIENPPVINLILVMNDPQLWDMLYQGLIQSDSRIRKQCQMVFKRIFDICQSDVHTYNYEGIPILQSLQISSLANSWIDYFIILELLEEPQAHLIKPMFSKLLQQYQLACSENINCIPLSWVLLLFQRSFCHYNRNIQQLTMTMFLHQECFCSESVSVVMQYTVSHLFNILENTYIFGMGDSEIKMNVSKGLSKFFNNLFYSCDAETKKVFLRTLLNNIFDGRAWGSVPLYHIVRSLPLSTNTGAWGFDDIKSAVINYQRNLSTHDNILRSAVQCRLLILIFKHAAKVITVMQLSSLLKLFNQDECWKRGSKMWNLMLDYLMQNNANTEEFHQLQYNVENYFRPSEDTNNADKTATAIAICLVMDTLNKQCNRSSPAILCDLLRPIFIYLKDCEVRPYLDMKKVIWAVDTLTEVFDILNNTCSIAENLVHKNTYIAAYRSTFKSLLLFLIKAELSYDTESSFFSSIIRFFNVLREFSKSEVENVTADSIYHFTDSVSSFQHFRNRTSDFAFMYEFTVINYYDKCNPCYKRQILDIAERYLETEKFQNKLILHPLWNALALIAAKDPLSFSSKFIKNLPSVIESACRHTVGAIFRLTLNLVPKILKDNNLDIVVTHMVKTSEEYRKGCDLYRTLISHVACVLFHPDIIADTLYHDTVIEIAKKFIRISEDVLGVSNVILQPLINTLFIHRVKMFLDATFILEIILPLALSGIVYPKQLKVMKDTINFIQNSGDECFRTNESEYDSDKKARVMVVRFLLSLKTDELDDHAVACSTATAIQKQFELIRLKKKARDFPNSYNHHLKTRLLQLFLLLIPFFNVEQSRSHLSWLSSVLSEEQQLPSIRFFLEWIMAILCLRNNSLLPDFFKEFDKGINIRLGCTASFLASLTLLACTSEEKNILEKSLEKVLPWTMSNHYNIRLYAQMSLKTIWTKITGSNKYDDIKTKFQPLYGCLFAMEEKMVDEFKNVYALRSEFFFSALSPLDHYSVQTIFYDFPRLSLMACEEWITPEYIENIQCSNLPFNSKIPLMNTDAKLSTAEPPIWVRRTAEKEKSEDSCEREDVSNIQRKMTPWTSMLADMNLEPSLLSFDRDSSNKVKRVQRKNQLIIVGSLIEKLPNLGGLCRTCEIFGISEFVVPSLVASKDPLFTALSLTAHQWTNMKEVKPNDLIRYLGHKREEGYSLVGVEQTSKSISLEQFRFPEKTLLILGNEREGIPCDLLQLMDSCIEIPQSGILRSLNVHVSGSSSVLSHGQTTEKEFKLTNMSLPRRTVINRTAVVYGKTPIGIQRRIFLQMAKKLNLAPSQFCKKILSLSEDELFNLITEYSCESSEVNYFYQNFDSYKIDNDDINSSCDIQNRKLHKKLCNKKDGQNHSENIPYLQPTNDDGNLRLSNSTCDKEPDVPDGEVTSQPMPSASSVAYTIQNNANRTECRTSKTFPLLSSNCNLLELKRERLHRIYDTYLSENNLDDTVPDYSSICESNSLLTGLLFDDSNSKVKTVLKESPKKSPDRFSKQLGYGPQSLNNPCFVASNTVLEKLLFS